MKKKEGEGRGKGKEGGREGEFCLIRTFDRALLLNYATNFVVAQAAASVPTIDAVAAGVLVPSS